MNVKYVLSNLGQMNVCFLQQVFVMCGDQTDHVVVHFFVLVHGDCQIWFIYSGKEPTDEVEKCALNASSNST